MIQIGHQIPPPSPKVRIMGSVKCKPCTDSREKRAPRLQVVTLTHSQFSNSTREVQDGLDVAIQEKALPRSNRILPNEDTYRR